MSGFEEEYEGVLQNIEFAIINIYQHQPTLVDFDVENALDALIRTYQAQQLDRTPRVVALNALAQLVYSGVQTMCEWRLGRELPFALEGPTQIPAPKPITVAELIACLKRIRKSVRTWNKRGGRQGYLEFASQFFG